MKWLTLLFLTILITPNIAIADAIGSCHSFSSKLQGCKQYNCLMPYIKGADFHIEHTIKGRGKDGKCVYEQTMPGGGKAVCTLKEDTRNAIIAMWQDFIATKDIDLFSNSAKIFNKAFQDDECEIKGY